MRDHIVIAKHQDSGLFHALLYQNHPTPSGCDRPILRLSTPDGKATKKEALDVMIAGLKPEYLKTIDVPVIERSKPTSSGFEENDEEN